MPDNIIPLEVVPEGAQIPINISSALYARIQQLIFEGLPFKDMDEFIKSLQEAKSGNVTNPLSHHLQTLLHLCSLIEESAKANKLTSSKKFDVDKKSIVE